MTAMNGLFSGLWSVGVMGMMMSSWSHTWKAFGCEWVRAGGMFRGLTPSPSLLSLVGSRLSSRGPSKQSVDRKEGTRSLTPQPGWFCQIYNNKPVNEDAQVPVISSMRSLMR